VDDSRGHPNSLVRSV